VKILRRRRSVNVKGIPVANQPLHFKARITAKQVLLPPLPRFIKGAPPPLRWPPKPSQVRSAVLLLRCTTALAEMVARIK
jgi:hypothetical protein